MKVGLIVEGHGEIHSLPILLRKIVQTIQPQLQLSILPAFRIPRGQLVKEEGLHRAVEFMAGKVGNEGRILILLDADDDLPCVLGPRLLTLARGFRRDRDISVVIATPKGWLDQRMPGGYSETLHQPALTSKFDLTLARRSDSFDKLFREVGRLFGLTVPPR